MKISNSLKAILWMAAVAISITDIAAQTPNFDRLKEKFDAGRIFSAEFSHEFTDSYTGEVMASSGTIWIDEAGYKLESQDQILVVDGEITRVYDQTRNRVIIDNYIPEDDDFAPSKMLRGVDSTYSISEEKLDSRSRVILETTDDFAIFSRVEIMLDDQQNPTEITAIDISDNLIITTFKGGKFIEMTEDHFNLEYPDDADIIDLRE